MSGMSDHIAMEFSQITPHIMVGTSLCCEDHAQELKRIGAQLEIGLEYEHKSGPMLFGTFLWIPVPDHDAPNMEQLDIGTAVLAEAEAKGYNVYVHCKNGHGRGPTLVIAYFIRKGMTAEAAQETVRMHRGEIEITDAQKARLKEYEAKYLK